MMTSFTKIFQFFITMCTVMCCFISPWKRYYSIFNNWVCPVIVDPLSGIHISTNYFEMADVTLPKRYLKDNQTLTTDNSEDTHITTLAEIYTTILHISTERKPYETWNNLRWKKDSLFCHLKLMERNQDKGILPTCVKLTYTKNQKKQNILRIPSLALPMESTQNSRRTLNQINDHLLKLHLGLRETCIPKIATKSLSHFRYELKTMFQFFTKVLNKTIAPNQITKEDIIYGV